MSWDSPLVAVEELVSACAEAAVSHERLQLDRVVVDTPVELQVRVGDDGTVLLSSAPPRQALPTTVMPVLHRLRVLVVREEGA